MSFDCNWRNRHKHKNAQADLHLIRLHASRALSVAAELERVWRSVDSAGLLVSIRKLIAEIDLAGIRLVDSSEVPPCEGIPGTAAE
jgi:hypothetical protein